MFFSAESLQNISEIDRDELLQLDDRDLADHCKVDVFVGKGPGGQHRNRNYTAVRVVFKYDRSFAAEDCTSRSQQQNLSGALNKLRIMLAIFWRKKTDANIAYTHLAKIRSRKTRQKNHHRPFNCDNSRCHWYRPTSIIILSRSYVIMINTGCFGGVVTQRSAKPRTPVQFR